MPRHAATIVLLLLSCCVLAQQPQFTHHKWFGVEDGLPQSFVSGIQQDQDGFLWVGTRDGLARYDGRDFTIYRQNQDDSLGLRSNVITDIFLDAGNLLWIFYVNEKVDCFDPRRMRVCYRDSFSVARKLLAQLKTSKFIRDRAGRFWYNSNEGVVCYDPVGHKTSFYNQASGNLSGNDNLGIAEDASGRMAIFTEKGLDIIGPGMKPDRWFYPFPSDMQFRPVGNAYNKVAALSDGRVLLTHHQALIIFNPDSASFSIASLHGLGSAVKDDIGHLQEGPDGKLYIEAGGDIFAMDQHNRMTWIWKLDHPNPYARDVRSFLADKSGVIWFGTNALGMFSVNLRAIPFHSRPYGINFAADVFSGMPGLEKQVPPEFLNELWAYGLRYSYGPGNQLWVTYRENEESVEVQIIYKLINGKFERNLLPGGKHRAIRGLSRTHAGHMFASDLYGNTWKWEMGAGTPVYSPSMLPLAVTSSVVDMEADDEYLWFATNKEGLYKTGRGKLITHFQKNAGDHAWPADQLTDLCADPTDKEILWIGTLGHGLIRLNKTSGHFNVFTDEDGLPNNTVYGIVPDASGNLWISTNKGISRYDPVAGEFYNFSKKDGLAGDEFNRFHHLLLPDGRIAFGGPSGYTLFHPGQFVRDTFPTSVAFTKILVNNQPLAFTGGKDGLTVPLNQLEALRLPYNRNFLQFEFAGMQFNQPEKINYRYRLKGYDKEWILTGDHNMAVYTRLPPGRYTLLINASNTSGQWSPIMKELRIRVLPPFWASWWAYTIYGILVLLGLRVYWNYRSNRIRMQHAIELEKNKARQLREVDEIKDRFFSNITHELRTPLTLILTPLEKLIGDEKFGPGEKNILATAYRNAGHLLRLINQLLDISKIESKQMKVNVTVGDLPAFAERCVQQFQIQAGSRRIDLGFSHRDIRGQHLFDEEKWEKIIFNLVGNAIKFTGEGGTVHVDLAGEGEDEFLRTTVRLSVTDTGRGIPEKDIPRLFDRFYMVDDSVRRQQGGTGIGLALVKELVELMHGKIEVESAAGEGARFSISMPLARALAPADQLPANLEAPGRIHPPDAGATDLAPLILIAEDNEELRSFLVQQLAEKWRVMEASNGSEAHDLVISELPEIVISDYMMPVMDGESLCRLVKGDPRTAHISFIMLTAKAAHESVITGLEAGADEYVTKPFHFDELEARIQNLLLQQQRWRQRMQEEALPEVPLPKLPHVNDLFLQNVYAYLEENMDEPGMDVEKLASAMAMSRRTLGRKLKAVLNISPNELIRRFRLQKAAILLSSGLNVTETAYTVGFETPSYFAACFKEQYGQTPTEFASSKTA